MIFVEPLLHPGIEVQALGRVDRIGQTRHTYVHRFVVNGTVEGSVMRVCEGRKESMGLQRGGVARRSVGGEEEVRLRVWEVREMLLEKAEEERDG